MAFLALYARLDKQPWEAASLELLLPGWRDRPDQATIWQAYEEGQALNAERAAAVALGDDAA